MRKPFLFLIAAMIIACYPNRAFSQAKINGGTNVSYYAPVLSWGTNSFQLPTANTNYSMNDFEVDKSYKIVIAEDSPNLVTNLKMYIAKNYPLDGVITYSALSSDAEFQYQSNYGLYITFDIPANTTIGQTQLLKFQIYRKRILNIWDWQTSFFVYVNTTCVGDWDYIGSLGAGDYEVGGNLTVSSWATPGSGVTELDGGQSVTMKPGFYTNMSSGSTVLAIIDGCGGAYRPGSTNGTEGNTIPKVVMGKELRVYPNPATDKCHVYIPENASGKTLQIRVMDINGRILRSEEKVADLETEVDLSAFDAGLYFINISGTEINYNQKIIKQ